MKSLNFFTALLLTIISIGNIKAQSYDFTVSDLQVTNPTGITVGSSITAGTALNEISFDITNAGSITIPAGTVLPVTLDIGSNSYNLNGSLSASLSVNSSTTFTIDCTASGLNYNFPTATGNFNICVTTTFATDPRSSNNKLCRQYSIASARTIDLTIKSGSISVSDPTGITPGTNIPLGTALNEISFEVENAGNFGLGTGSTIALVIEVNGVTKNGSFTLTSNLFGGQTVALRTNVTASGLDLNFPTSNGQFNICVTASNTLDVNKTNDRVCQQYTMGTSAPTPTVTNMSPVSGPVGTTVTISGNNFATTGNMVLFAPGIAGTILSSTSSSVRVTVPTNANTGMVQLTTAGAQLNCGTFTVTTGGGGSHTITSIAPASGPIGTEVTITGTGFSTTVTANTVTFSGGMMATVKTATTTSLVVDVPSGASSGLISVAIAGNTKNSPTSFTVVTPGSLYISDFTPKRGAIGQQVIIEGDMFNSTPSNNIVTFSGSANATIISGTNKRLVVKVPPGTVDGTFTLNNGSGTTTSPQSFFVENGPVITKLNPSSGLAGSNVKIEGFNFSNVDSENKVLFGSVDAGIPIVNAAATELRLTVPPGLALGKYPVRLEVTGFTIVSAPYEYSVISEAVGVLENSKESGLSIYKNQEGLNVRIRTTKAMHNAKVFIHDIRGLKVFEQGFNAEGETEYIHTMSPQLHSGVYILSIEDENNGIQTQKFVVAQ